MKKLLVMLVAAAAIAVAGCAQFEAMGTSIGEAVVPSTPEGVVNAAGAANTAAIVTATQLLAAHKISVKQAESYRTMLKGSVDAIDNMNGVLLQCRSMTGSTRESKPDPCKQSVISVMGISLQTITAVKKELDAAK